MSRRAAYVDGTRHYAMCTLSAWTRLIVCSSARATRGNWVRLRGQGVACSPGAPGQLYTITILEKTLQCRAVGKQSLIGTTSCMRDPNCTGLRFSSSRPITSRSRAEAQSVHVRSWSVGLSRRASVFQALRAWAALFRGHPPGPELQERQASFQAPESRTKAMRCCRVLADSHPASNVSLSIAAVAEATAADGADRGRNL